MGSSGVLIEIWIWFWFCWSTCCIKKNYHLKQIVSICYMEIKHYSLFCWNIPRNIYFVATCELGPNFFYLEIILQCSFCNGLVVWNVPWGWMEVFVPWNSIKTKHWMTSFSIKHIEHGPAKFINCSKWPGLMIKKDI